MKNISLFFFFIIIFFDSIGQVVISPKGTKIVIDSSKWKITGNNIYNKNSGNLGIGTSNPTAQLHTTGDIRFEGIGSNVINTKILTADGSGNITTRLFSNLLSANIITNTMLSQIPSQVFKGRTSTGTGNVEDLSSTQATAMLNVFSPTLKGLVPLSGGGTTNFLRADGIWAAPSNTGGTVTSIAVEDANGLGGIVTNPTSSASIALSTSVTGMVIGDGTGFLAASPGTDYTDGTANLSTGILKSTSGTGDLSIASASDFPILNQNTNGNAATATTSANGTITDDNITNSATRILWANGAGAQALKSSSSKLTFNPSTGTLYSGTFNGSGAELTNIPNNATTATSSNTASTIISRDALGNFSAGVINATSFNGAFNGTASTVITNANLTGPITSVGNATAIGSNVLTNAMLAQVNTQTFKGRATSGSGNVEDLTISQAKNMLNLTGTNSGDQTISLTGDITGSGANSFATTISAGVVSYAKMQNVSASGKVLGRVSSGAGSVEEINTTGTGNIVRSNSPTLVTPIGIVKSDVGLGNVDNTSDVAKPISTLTQAGLDLKINVSEKGANNGVATLDAGGKVLTSQLPVGSQVYKGTWNAATNTPTLANGVGTAGWTYRVTTGGTINLGSGSITFSIGDDAIYNGTVWQRNPSSSAVTSVNSQTGSVVLNSDNINEGSINKYYTDTRTRNALSVSSPLNYNATSGLFTLSPANTSTNGYLSSSDWNIFNNKQASGNYITGIIGDVVANGPGSVSSTISPNAVTFNKMQQINPNKLLGSGSVGTSVSEITLGTGLSFSGNTLNAANTGGTVTDISIVSANGFNGSVVNSNTIPQITLTTTANGMLKGSGGAITSAGAGIDYSNGTSTLSTGILKSTTGTGTLSIATAGDFPVLNQNTTGNAATVTTNANLTGPVTSVGNATTIATNVVANSMLSQISTQVFKGRTTAGTGNVEDLTATQATAMLNTFSATTKGLVPASGGGTANFLRADGTFATPSGTAYRSLVTTTADVINNNSTANTLVDVTGLSFNVIAGNTYRFYAMIPYTSAATNTGSRWTINAPATTLLNYTSRYTLTATSQTVNYASAINIPSSCNNTSTSSANLAIIEGVIKPSANGTVQIRFASEVANSAITAKAGATLEYW